MTNMFIDFPVNIHKFYKIEIRLYIDFYLASSIEQYKHF